jgi:putative transposase
MPNHFHFMLIPNEEACAAIKLGDKMTHMQNLSKAIGKTLSSYTKAINFQNQTTGNLFQKKTQAKCITVTRANEELTKSCLLTCFHYIHQNPLSANLIRHLKDWKFSSYPAYYKYRNGTLSNKDIAMKLLSLSENDFKK